MEWNYHIIDQAQLKLIQFSLIITQDKNNLDTKKQLYENVDIVEYYWTHKTDTSKIFLNKCGMAWYKNKASLDKEAYFDW